MPTFAPPRNRGQQIARPQLVARLATGDAPVVLLEAPAGYGKTRLLAEWQAAAGDDPPFVWVSLRPCDADPARLAGSIHQRLPHRGPAAREANGPNLVDHLPDELAVLPERTVLVLDDGQHLHGSPVHELLDAVVAGLPTGGRLAIATRTAPPLPLARLRAAGALLEIRTDDLRFRRVEAGALLDAAGVVLDPAAVADLVERCEGWPTGLALAGQALRAEPDAAAFSGRHRHVADWFDEEVLRHQAPATSSFLLRTSILERMCAGLCDAVTGRGGSQAVLDGLERSNLFVVPLDQQRTWYRLHRLFREMLRTELARHEPALAAELHRRASVWNDAEGLRADAAEHALAALRLVPPAMPPPVRAPIVLDFGQRLTDRELTILRLLPSRLSQREIARELYVSVNTVKTHNRAIYRKLGVSSRHEATSRARDLGLLIAS